MGGALPTARAGGTPNLSTLPEELTSAFMARIDSFRRRQTAVTILSWTAIFGVKYSFLAYFQQLVRRVRRMVLYWRGIVVFTGIAYIYCVSEHFFSCREARASESIRTVFPIQ